jgi:hypothetical protein
MSPIEASHEVMQTIPKRLTDGGNTKPTTAYYTDVPVTSLPAGCTIKPMEGGFTVSGQIQGCAYFGQLFEGSDPTHYRRAILSFVKVGGAQDQVH